MQQMIALVGLFKSTQAHEYPLLAGAGELRSVQEQFIEKEQTVMEAKAYSCAGVA